MDKTTNTEERNVKVTVPVRLRMKLHILKILEGQNISETVKLALEDYFEKTGMDEVDLPREEMDKIGLGTRKKPQGEA